MNKKLIAKVTAAACALSLLTFPVSVPGLTKADEVKADEATSDSTVQSNIQTKEMGAAGEQNVEVKQDVKMPTIKVTIPTSFKYYLDPYNAFGAGQIAMEEGTIVNDSEIGVSVNATVQAKPGKGVTLVSKAITDKDTSKSVYMWLEMYDEQPSEYSTSYVKTDPNKLLFTTAATTSKNPLVKLDKDATGYFKFSGQVNTHPATAWAAGDTVNTTLKFIINPVLPEN